MRYTRLTTLCMFLTLLFAQLATAQHSSVHLGHSSEIYEIVSDHLTEGDQQDHSSSNHTCPECLLAKSLQVTLSATAFIKSVTPFETQSFQFQSDIINITSRVKDTYARGPPTLLI